MPGFTHLQAAQPVTLGHHLMAYYEMLRRDRSRFADARARLNECPLGAAALAGTSFPLDREATAAALGFDGPMANSLGRRLRSRLRARLSDSRDPVRAASLAPRRGIDHLGEPALRLRLAAGRIFDRLVDHAAEAQSGRRRAGARPFRPDRRRDGLAGDDDEGAAARLFEGHAGRQAARLRGARSADAVARRRLPAWSRRRGSTPAACARQPRPASPPRPISPTGWSAAPASRSARRTISPAAR